MDFYPAQIQARPEMCSVLSSRTSASNEVPMTSVSSRKVADMTGFGLAHLTTSL